MRGGSRLGLDLRGLAQSVKRGELKGWQAAGTSTTGLDELALRLDASQGVVRATILQAKSGTNMFSGNGTIDLAKQALDFSLALGSTDPSLRPAARDVVLLSGPWGSPSIRLGRADEMQQRFTPVTAPASSTNQP